MFATAPGAVKFLIALLAATVASGLQGCVFTLVNATTPDDGYERVVEIPYGEQDRQTLDFYWPNTEESQDLTLVFFYGGGWQGGKKNNYRFVAQAFAKEGYRIAIPNYRVYPEVLFPSFVEDGAEAISAVLEYQPDSKLVLIGHSAGAHIAAMLAHDHSYLQNAGVTPSLIEAWVGWSGPYDFLPLTSNRLKKIFSGADDIAKTQPVNFVDAGDPAALLIQGRDDSTVIPRNTERMAAQMREANIPVEAIYYDDVGHIGTVGALAPLFDHWSTTLADTLQFLDSVSAQPGSGGPRSSQ